MTADYCLKTLEYSLAINWQFSESIFTIEWNQTSTVAIWLYSIEVSNFKFIHCIVCSLYICIQIIGNKNEKINKQPESIR